MVIVGMIKIIEEQHKLNFIMDGNLIVVDYISFNVKWQNIQ